MKRVKMELYTLCLEGTAIAICALENEALRRDAERVIRDAFFETWGFGGGELMRLIRRKILARPPTKKEGRMWEHMANATGKSYLVLGGGGEARGVA
jgi:hypothetical protein